MAKTQNFLNKVHCLNEIFARKKITVFTELLQCVEATFRFSNVYRIFKCLNLHLHFKNEIKNFHFFQIKDK